MTGLKKSAAAALLSALTACTYMSNDLDRLTDQTERRFGPGLGRDYHKVGLREVAQNATSYKHVSVEFTAIFNRRNEQIFVPLLTTFNSESWTGFSVWPSDARLWEEQDRLSMVPTLYLSKTHEDNSVLSGLNRYALVRVRGEVIGDFDDRPFIQVTWLEEIEPALYTDEGLAAVNAGYAALQQKRPAVAIEKLEASLNGVWTRDGRLRVHLELAALYAERGDWDAAIIHYEGALANDPENAKAKAGIEKAREELARKAAVEAGAPKP